MQNKVLADLVLQKMKEKKEQELRNMPHYKILQLLTTFDYQRHLALKQELSQLQGTLSHLQNTLLTLEERSEQLQYTGKRNFPRIIIKPDFIASEKIEFKLKEFYRKLSNTFLRLGILRNKKTAKSQETFEDLTYIMNEINRVQNEWRKRKEEQRFQTNNKRKKVEKQKLRLDNLYQQIKLLKNAIKKQREDNIVLVKEYEVKKGGMETRKKRLTFVEKQIKQYKRKIQQEFNPLVYREHIAKMSILQAKNQFILDRLRAVNNQISSRSNNQHSTSVFKCKKRVYSARNKDQKLITESFIGISNNKKSVYLGIKSTLDFTNDRASLNMSGFNKIESQQEFDKGKMRFHSQSSQICEKRHSLYSKLTNYVVNQNKRKGI